MPLDPVARTLLDEVAASGRPNAHLLPVTEARANFEALFAGLRPGEPVSAVADHAIPVDGAAIPARSYRPQIAAAGEPLALVVYFHGGGWLLGSVESHDTVCRALANASGAVVLNVGYRLAPEARFPAAADDALAATRWAHANAALLGADPARLAVAGDSAGGNLAAVVCQDLRTAGEPIVRFQLLIYPVTTADLSDGFDMAYEGYFLYRDEMPGTRSTTSRRRPRHATLASRPCSATRPICRRPPSRRPSATRCTRRPSSTGIAWPAPACRSPTSSTPA